MTSIVKPAYAALSLMLPATVFSGHANAMDDMSDAHAHHHHMMNHTPVTFLRAAPGHRWVRIDGFATADELARGLHELVAAR